jgi:chromosomal replication initiator protein
MPINSLWNECLQFFEGQLSAQQFNSWIRPIVFESDGSRITLTAPNSFTQKVIQERFLPEISRRAQELFISPIKIELKTEKKNVRLASQQPLLGKIQKINDVINTDNILPIKSVSKLNNAYLFENFVIGKANQLAHAAAIQVSDNLGSTYNPLFIYGGVGLGKTHLLQSIGNQVRKEKENTKIHYVHATNYISDVVRAFQTKRFDEFKQFYNSLDLLLIDDIQFIADKPGTQQEFFYTLNSLIDKNKQIVITCDTFPKEINGIEPRLTSRFGSGLTVSVEPPGIEMRVAILLQKSIQSKNPINEDVAFFIAKHIRSNIRELEGALNRIEAFARFHKRPITIELAKEALKDLLSAQNKQISIENIQKTVADYYRIKLIDLLSKKRLRIIVRPRQMAMFIARELTQLSLPEIGSSFGGRDHTTVLHACKTITELRNNNSMINSDYILLTQILRH